MDDRNERGALRRARRSWFASYPVWRPLLGILALLLAWVGMPLVAHAAGARAPCDIYRTAGTPCVAAHSTTRALYARYDGPLYQVRRSSDGTVRNIGLLAVGGYADATHQDGFCAHTSCVITTIYDQSPMHNDLIIESAGSNGNADTGAPANALPVEAGGHKVYGVEISAGMGYRNDATSGVAVNGQPETMYMVTSGTHVNGNCCFDYGNAETNNGDNGNGHMDAINFGTECWFGSCAGGGPWVQADMENGLFQSDLGYGQNPLDGGNPSAYVTALLKNNGQDYMAIKAGNAQAGVLSTEYAGNEPSVNGGGYSPMHQEGAIVLGTGGDNSNGSIGSFFEGVMTAGLAPDAADDAVQANIVRVGYGGPTGRHGTLTPGSEIALRATTACCTADYLRNQTGTVALSPISPGSPVQDRLDATWIVRRGLGDPTCLSFEAKDSPGSWVRHFDFQLFVNPDDGSAQFEADATFCPVAGNSGVGNSFYSVEFPTDFIRHYNYLAYIASDGGSFPFDNTVSWTDDTSFLVSRPWLP